MSIEKTGVHTHIFKLSKGLCGLKQSALNWSRLLHQLLVDLGYAQAAKDQCTSGLKKQNAGPFGAAALQGSGDRGRKEGGGA